jgi:hypothetical protein
VVFLFELLVSQQAVKKIGINGVAKGGSEKDRLSKSVVKGCEVKSEHRAAQGRGCWSARQRALEAKGGPGCVYHKIFQEGDAGRGCKKVGPVKQIKS